ncbi:CcoQ/FixQ family Cbb3-type cytochrome c oxidase assembly chaperone [Chitinimonas arctica]|uniref:CcoQ/FixQ family Cbb3-type cytochrome c oxidase assembly chaperone n=1 Tax=Chitinimonas arctica TaxID=2594795 RepID=A0A516SC95_9NEIS|nr:CcoQ/FixQ family Cbb3-type cytochrome c oxidase assembly chaperone [Chitinimonas arctica]QDQ25771.1 CcoQ/FixQ family Cbb3-type cytochrome c oxidase assembly chaperone [Chitinimonas arctica]
MDINLFRILVTVAGLLSFFAIAVWAWGKPAQKGFDEAAMQPINDDDLPHGQAGSEK